MAWILAHQNKQQAQDKAGEERGGGNLHAVVFGAVRAGRAFKRAAQVDLALVGDGLPGSSRANQDAITRCHRANVNGRRGCAWCCHNDGG